MRQKSLFRVLFPVFGLAVVLYALFLAMDVADQARMQNARTEQALGRLSSSLDRLGESLENLRYAQPAAPAAGEAAAASAAPANRFANDDLRDPDAEDGGSRVTRILSMPANLNALITQDAIVSDIQALLLGSLASPNYNDLTRYEPELARSWEVSGDGLEYTVHLRRNAVWQACTDPVTKEEIPERPLTSGDFLFYWEVMQNERIPCEALRTYHQDMEGLEVVDDHTFIVRWKRPYSLSEAITLGLQPLPRHYYRPDPSWTDEEFAEQFVSSPRNQWLIGTGPYKLVRYDVNSGVDFERDENYYGPKPSIQSLRMRLIADNSVSFLEFKRGELDAYGLQPAQWHEETPEPDFRLVTPDIATAHADSLAWDARKKAGTLPENYLFEKFQYNSTSWSYIGYNLQKPLFADRRTRIALTHLVNRDRILDEVHLGLGRIISGPFIPQSPYYNHGVEPLPFSIARASEILAEAGWEDTDGDGILDRDYDGSGQRKPFRFTLSVPSSSTQIRQIAAIVEQDMLKAKIKVDIKPIEWSVYTQLIDQREFEATCLLWSGGVEGDPYQLWHSSGANRKASSNYVGYDSAEADALIEAGRREVDREKRYEIYRRFHEVIAADQPYTFLVAPTAVLAQSKRFRNAVVFEGGMSSRLQWIPRALQIER